MVAFKNIQKEILQVIKWAQMGHFNSIDNLHLSPFVKWKIAFLYSNEQLIPIFSSETLLKIAAHYRLRATHRTPVATIQQIMMEHKQLHFSIFEYSDDLFRKFGKNASSSPTGKRRGKRKAATARSVRPQHRRGLPPALLSKSKIYCRSPLEKG